MGITLGSVFKDAWRAVGGAERTVGRDLSTAAGKLKAEAGWAALALGDTPLPEFIQTAIVRMHQPFAAVPHDGPLMTCPPVQPLDPPVAANTSRPVETWTVRAGTLTSAAPARAVAVALPAGGEGQVTLTAAAPGTDWGTRGHESAVVSIFVDGRYNQDVVLYGGATPTAYPLSLGTLPAGHHTITVAYNQAASTPGATGVQVSSLTLDPPGQGLSALAEKYQPYFYGRGVENNHTDVPLMMWCETSKQGEDTVLAYSVMHSNEDGGTASDPVAEQSSWGRLTDPDPICWVVLDPAGRIVETRYDGWLDESSSFHGTYEGTHPILRVAGTNNSYDDRGTTALLFRPRVQLENFTGSSRESLMDRNPWMYKLSNEELQREGKVETPAQAAATLASEGTPGFQRPAQVMDLRQYLYVDLALANPGHSQVAVAVKLKGDAKWYRSDLGDTTIDVLWAGSGMRTSVPLPAGTRPQDVEAVRVLDNGGSAVTLGAVNKVFMLDDAYQPQPVALAGATRARTVGKYSQVQFAAL